MRESFANFFTDMRFFTCKKITDSLLCICERGKGPKDDSRVRVGSQKPKRTRRAAESEILQRTARHEAQKGGREQAYNAEQDQGPGCDTEPLVV